MLEGLLAFERMTMALLKEAHEHNNHKVVFWVCIEPNNMGDKVFHYNCNIVIVINYYICFCFFCFSGGVCGEKILDKSILTYVKD
jgi:hypothetical protein